MSTRINWDKAEKEGLHEGYMHEVQQKLAPRMCRVLYGVDQLSQDMSEVADMLVETAERLLSRVQPKGRSSSAAGKVWKLAGTPSEGPFFEEKGRLRRVVRQRVRLLERRGNVTRGEIGCLRWMIETGSGHPQIDRMDAKLW